MTDDEEGPVSGERSHRGGCLCGAVRYEVRGPLRPALVCHCGMCQRLHGGPAHYSAAERRALRFLRDDGLVWYRSSPSARRGHCRICGASLFWQPEAADYTAVSCGSLDRPNEVRAAGHIFMVDKGDYYEVCDGLPQFQGSSGGRIPEKSSLAGG